MAAMMLSLLFFEVFSLGPLWLIGSLPQRYSIADFRVFVKDYFRGEVTGKLGFIGEMSVCTFLSSSREKYQKRRRS
ncbi:MAG: hypothetical protein IKU90_05175, partial [Clostridia bacterium]|nr:hypothetical protein [Clostridia bacterium]